MGVSRTFFTAIVFLTASIVAQCYGEIIVLRHPPTPDNWERSLTCISDDDQAVLIWNYNDQSIESNKSPRIVRDFEPRSPTLETVFAKPYCAVWNTHSECRAVWYDKRVLKLVNSAEVPTGPVFDYRWEGLEEYTSQDTQEYQYIRKVPEPFRSLVFSARGQDINILLCETENSKESACFRIIIGREMGRQSSIWIYNPGTNKIVEPENCDGCDKVNTHWQDEGTIDLYEWRTFRIEWTSDSGKIKLLKNTDPEPFLQGEGYRTLPGSHVFLRSSPSSRVRFHFYEYLLTEERDVQLLTTEITTYEEDFRVDVLVGLCPTCSLQIVLQDYDSDSQIGDTKVIRGSENAARNGLLSWQPISLNISLPRSYPNYLRLRIETILNKGSNRGQWAVDTFYMRKSVGELRDSTITVRKNSLTKAPIWPQVNCQKLSYHDSVVVDTLSTNMIYHETHGLRQIIDSLAASCGTFCPKLDEEWSICSSVGCGCNRGFRGDDCKEHCVDHTYGYECSMKCGSCHEGYCDKISGRCTECSNGTRLPPMCRELEQPNITMISDATAEVLQNVDYEAVEIIKNVRFSIKLLTDQTLKEYQGNRQGWSTYGTRIDKLQPNRTYKLKTIITINDREIESPETTFVATSLAAKCFKIDLRNDSIGLYWRQEDKECGHQPTELYSLDLKSGERSFWQVVTSVFPYIFGNLYPYTKYELIVSGRFGATLWTENVRTRESAPDKVAKLEWYSVTQNEVTLTWTPPIAPHGVITKYDVSLERIRLRGCKETTPPKFKIKISQEVTGIETTASFRNTTPYATYVATVIAYTSKPGPERTLEFPTAESDIPTSVVRNLKLVNNQSRLEWDEPDCTTITTFDKNRILYFVGISEWVEEWTVRTPISHNYYDLRELVPSLLPYTSYGVRVYVAKSDGRVNPDLYAEKNWTTAASAPPRVSELQVYEADPESNTVSLRWKPPFPPYGEIESYHVMIHNTKMLGNYTIKVPEEIKMCEQFVCHENVHFSPNTTTIAKIEVYAKNKGIPKPGEPKCLTNSLDFYYNQTPGEPQNLRAINQGGGVVKLTWSHPSFSFTKIKQFIIVVNYLQSKLLETPSTYAKPVNYPVTQKQQNYSTLMPLAPSTEYNFFIVAVNGRAVNSSPNKTRCWITDSVGFVMKNESLVTFDGTTIEINIPEIVNATRNTTMKVILKGQSLCTATQGQELSPQFKPVTEWLAAMYQMNDTVPREPLKIGSDAFQSLGAKCSLDIKKTEAIVFVVEDRYSGKSVNFSISLFQKEPTNGNLIWLLIFPLVAICVLLLFVVYRRLKKTQLEKSQRNLLQLEQMTMGMSESTALSTVKRPMDPPDAMINPMPISQPSPDVVPIYNPNSCPVEVEKFEQYVQGALESGLLDSQYEELLRSLAKPCNYATLPENAPKNRYKDRVPYDDTRVVLEKIRGDPYSDYINANYLQGHRKKRAYIATQGPKPNTINDFWRMIWQEKAQVLCMLANVIEGRKKKCEQYWPEVGAEEKYGNILVSHTKHQVFADYTIRTFVLVCRKETREVTHLHYTGWPDHGVPMYTQSLVAYLKKLLATSTGSGPVVVHCSAGVGRTGTIILCDICLRRAVAERIIDVPAALVKMREERANMVDNSQQYLLVHLAIVESMVVEQTQLNCNSLLIQKITELRKQLPSDIQRLDDAVWQDRALHSLSQPGPPSQGDVTANLPPVSPTLVSQTKSIDFVDVVGVKMKNQFLAAQLPSKSTLSDIWTLIMERNIELVVVLQRPSPKDPKSCNIVPIKSTLDPAPNLEVERKMVPEVTDHFTIDTLTLTDKSTQAAQQHPVTVITCTGWESGKHGKPPAAAALVSLWMTSEKIPRKEGQTLVLCHDGVTGCGLYLALSFLLERMAVERECDVISAVRAVRRSRTEFLQSPDQFEYLYDAAVDYAKCFEIYSNFS